MSLRAMAIGRFTLMVCWKVCT